MEPQSRRDILRLAAAAVAAPAVAQHATAAGYTPAFFTPEEFHMVDELSEIIIPADDHSPGARAAGVAAFIDKSLAEAYDNIARVEWRTGLQTVDAISRELNGAAFLNATPEQRLAVVAKIAANESHPKKPEEIFFNSLKHRTAHAYYTSKIGIHQEIEYKGNVLLNEFAGYDASLVPVSALGPAKS